MTGDCFLPRISESAIRDACAEIRAALLDHETAREAAGPPRSYVDTINALARADSRLLYAVNILEGNALGPSSEVAA